MVDQREDLSVASVGTVEAAIEAIDREAELFPE